MTIEVYSKKISRTNIRQIDEFILEKTDGIFRSYESVRNDKENPRLIVDITIREEVDYDSKDKLTLAVEILDYAQNLLGRKLEQKSS